MVKQGRPFVITTLIVAFTIFYSGNALKCYQCNSLENNACAEGNGPLPRSMIIECKSPSTTTPEPTITSTSTITSTTTSTTSPTSTSSSTTTPTSTSSSTTTLSSTSSSAITPTSTSSSTTTPSPKIMLRNRLRRSIFQNTDAEEWNCAIIKHHYNDRLVTERNCVSSSYTCIESSDDECEVIKKCNTDECNSANMVTINMVTLIWIILSWMTVFIFTGSY